MYRFWLRHNYLIDLCRDKWGVEPGNQKWPQAKGVKLSSYECPNGVFYPRLPDKVEILCPSTESGWESKEKRSVVT